MRLGFIGPMAWFANHFPEGWEADPEVLCLDVNHGSYENLRLLRNFRPNVTVFYRPELFPRTLVELVPGYRVAFLSEPLPRLVDGQLEHTDETQLRLRVYSSMQWTAFHRCIFYDPSQEASATLLGFPIDEFRPLPIDISLFHPYNRPVAAWDVVFVGKPTPHRIAMLDFLRVSKLRFLWVAHGCTGAPLADLFRGSRIVLNVHADGKPQMEPRILLGAACGALVVTEALGSKPTHLRGRITECEGPWTDTVLRRLMEEDAGPLAPRAPTCDIVALSVRRLADDLAARAKSEHSDSLGIPGAGEL